MNATSHTALQTHSQRPNTATATSELGSSQTCHLLCLPIELIFMVADYLRPHEMSILAQTCRSLRAITSGTALATNKLEYDDLFDYLRCMSYSNPETWVCANCVQLHSVTEHHLSEEWWDTLAYRHAANESLVPLYENQICSEGYRHVQLSLKYDRLSDKNSECEVRLQRLLTPYYGEPKYLNFNTQALLGHLSAVPRVVKGRYILKSTWTFDGRDGLDISPEVLGVHIDMCNHQSFGRLRRRSLCTLRKAIDNAFETKDVRVIGNCESCLTDFTVLFSANNTAEITSWKDFGGETSPTSDFWKVNCYGFQHICLVNDQRGKIRNLYERASM